MIFVIPIWVAMICFVLGIIFTESLPERKKICESLFVTPADRIKFTSDHFPGTCNHGNLDCTVSATNGSLAFRTDRSIRLIDIDSGKLGKDRKHWMKQCYFQPADPYLTGTNGNLWVYTDDQLTRARLVGECSASADISTMRPEFAKIFDTPFDVLNFGDYYRRDNKFYFHVYSPVNPFKLKLGCTFQNIDLKTTDVTTQFPPRQHKENWMTRCYYYHKAATKTEAAEAFWIFLDEQSIETFVIGQYLSKA
jgi:hypothetical protein